MDRSLSSAVLRTITAGRKAKGSLDRVFDLFGQANTSSNRRPLANTFQTRLKLDPPCGASLAERLNDF